MWRLFIASDTSQQLIYNWLFMYYCGPQFICREPCRRHTQYQAWNATECETKFLKVGGFARFAWGQSGPSLPRSTTLRGHRAPPGIRQVLECVRASAAFRLAPCRAVFLRVLLCSFVAASNQRLSPRPARAPAPPNHPGALGRRNSAQKNMNICSCIPIKQW